jgi:hypothetical protein
VPFSIRSVLGPALHSVNVTNPFVNTSVNSCKMS